MSSLTRCRGCGRPLVFVKTYNGKSLPCDPERVPFVPDLNGQYLFVTDEGDVLRGTMPRPEDSDVHFGRFSHFATCPEAEKFRRPGKKARKTAAEREGG